MTIAICQKCGTEKFGAVTTCPSCGYCPMNGTDRDIVLSILFSDHYMDHKSLRDLGHDISKGVKIDVDEATLDSMTEKVSKHLDMFRKRPAPTKKWWQFWKD